jgi:hypothetical protein
LTLVAVALVLGSVQRTSDLQNTPGDVTLE